MSCLSTESAAGKVKNDFDGDGVADRIVLDNAKFDQDGLLKSKRLAITLSSLAKTTQGVVETSTGSLAAYQGANHNDLIVDFSNRSSRDAAELSYLVYKWNKQQQDFCLKASVDGVPANQLRGEFVPRQVEVARYYQCVALGGDLPENPLDRRESAALALSELSVLGKGVPIPEHLAFELANQVDVSNVTKINNAGYFQEQQNFLVPALILLESVHSRFPKRIAATLNLADTYWKLGNNDKACALYREYLSSIGSQKKAPARVKQRINCP